jgi:hypothetical protein
MSEQVFVEMESYYEPWQRWFENRIYPSDDGLSIFFHEITERKQAEQSAQDSARLLKGQNDVLELIARGTPLQDTLDLLLHVIESQSPGMLCSIFFLDPDNEHLRHGAAPSLPKSFTRSIDGKRIGPNAGSCGTAAFSGETVIVEDMRRILYGRTIVMPRSSMGSARAGQRPSLMRNTGYSAPSPFTFGVRPALINVTAV